MWGRPARIGLCLDVMMASFGLGVLKILRVETPLETPAR
jgi:hypothetical protein